MYETFDESAVSLAPKFAADFSADVAATAREGRSECSFEMETSAASALITPGSFE